MLTKKELQVALDDLHRVLWVQKLREQPKDVKAIQFLRVATETDQPWIWDKQHAKALWNPKQADGLRPDYHSITYLSTLNDLTKTSPSFSLYSKHSEMTKIHRERARKTQILRWAEIDKTREKTVASIIRSHHKKIPFSHCHSILKHRVSHPSSTWFEPLQNHQAITVRHPLRSSKSRTSFRRTEESTESQLNLHEEQLIRNHIFAPATCMNQAFPS